MSVRHTFQKLEQIYTRRKKIEAARKSALDQNFARQDRAVTALEAEQIALRDAQTSELRAVLHNTATALHYSTMLSALAARKVRHHNEMALLRYETLRRREIRDRTGEEVALQRKATRDATRQAEKIKQLLARENAASDAHREAAEEEEAAEAQASRSRPATGSFNA